MNSYINTENPEQLTKSLFRQALIKPTYRSSQKRSKISLPGGAFRGYVERQGGDTHTKRTHKTHARNARTTRYVQRGCTQTAYREGAYREGTYREGVYKVGARYKQSTYEKACTEGLRTEGTYRGRVQRGCVQRGPTTGTTLKEPRRRDLEGVNLIPCAATAYE